MSDEVMRALSDSTRRRVLRALRNHDYPLETPSLAASEAAVYNEALQKQEIELLHLHLPKLDDMGFIDWDREQEVVEKGPRFEDALPVLDIADTRDEPEPDDEGTDGFSMGVFP